MASDPLTAWESARADLVPSVGERMVDLLTVALLEHPGPDAADADEGRAVEADARARLTAGGDDPAAPAVTEVEAVLLDWARTGDEARLETAASPALRERLAALRAAADAL